MIIGYLDPWGCGLTELPLGFCLAYELCNQGTSARRMEGAIRAGSVDPKHYKP